MNKYSRVDTWKNKSTAKQRARELYNAASLHACYDPDEGARMLRTRDAHGMKKIPNAVPPYVNKYANKVKRHE